MAESKSERSLGELLATLTTQLGQLIHKEVELARTEITANAVRTGRDASLVGVGGVVIHAGFLAFVAAVIALLVSVLDAEVWVASLAVAIVLLGVGYLLVQRGKSQLEAGSMTPTRTIETLKGDAQWAKDQTR